jgi:hypothetical protein
LERAAGVVASCNESARLVIVVDAADNSIIAAQSQPTPEKSFVYDFVTLGDLPSNVCLIVTTRSGRLDSLRLPDYFISHKLDGFDRDETAAHIKLFWKDSADAWIDDFHHLSGGNPRVERYAIDYSASDQQKALSVLRPEGKNLGGIFKEAVQKDSPFFDKNKINSAFYEERQKIEVIGLPFLPDYGQYRGYPTLF